MQFIRFGISREVAKSILGEDWIQKSKKGEQKSDHKYIWRTPKETGKGYDYIYEEDQVKNPFDMLLKFFKIGKATVTKLYKDHNIEADYKATENQFAAHVLEYEAKKDKWDKIFSSIDKNKATQNPKTMAQAKDIEKKNAEKKGKEAVKNLESKKFVPNKTLMRKIWAIMNPEKAKEMDIAIAQMNAEKSKGVAETIDRQQAGNDKIRADFVGRRATIDRETGITTFTFTDGTVIQRDKKNNIVFDSRYDNAVTEETPVESNETFDETAYNDSHNWNAERIAKEKQLAESYGYDAFKSGMARATANDELFNNYLNDIQDNKDTISVEDAIKGVKSIKHQLMAEWLSGWDRANIESAQEEKESESEEHKNRSEAMRGNQNARKYGIDELITKDFGEIPSSSNATAYLNYGKTNIDNVTNKDAKLYGGLSRNEYDEKIKEYNKIKNENGTHSPKSIKTMIDIDKIAIEGLQADLNNATNDTVKASTTIEIIQRINDIKMLNDWFDLGKSNPKFFNKEWKDYLDKHPEEFINSNALSEAMMGNDNAAGEHNVESTPTVENTIVAESKMKKEQEQTKKAREKAGLPKIGINYGERVSAMEDAVSLNPNAENYAYKDTGYIAGSQKEKIQDFWKRKKESGEGTSIEEIDWNTLEENPRYAKQQITKDNILGKIDYAALKESGMDPKVAFLVGKVYSAIAKEPKGNTVEARKNYVIAVNTLKDRLMNCKTVKDVYEVMQDVNGEANQTYKSQISKDPEVVKLTNERTLLLNKRENIRHELLEKGAEIYRKYKELGKKERKAIRRYSEEIKNELEAKVREYDPNYKGGLYWFFEDSPMFPINMENPKAFAEEVDSINDKLRNKRNELVEKYNDTISTQNVWKELGDKLIDLNTSNSFYNHYKQLEIYDGERTTTFKNGTTGESFKWKYRDKSYDKYETWDWVDTKTTNKRVKDSEIIEGKVKRRFEMIVPSTLERVGGRDVSVKSTEELKKAFNLRDVQTGSYVQSDPVSAKWHVDNLAAGFADLCDVLGIRDDQVSLNGRLALAVGARGHGGALAHYEPVERVINITKMKGGGSLGHEWFHSFDNMIAEAMNGGDISMYMSDTSAQSKPVRLVDAFKPNAYHDELPAGEMNQKVKEKFENLVKAMKEGDTPETEVVTYTAKDVEEGKKLFETNRSYYSYYGGFFGDLSKCTNLNDAIKVINDKYKSTVDLISANSGKLAKLGKYEQKRIKETVRNYEKYRSAAVAYFDTKENKSEGGEGVVLTGRIVSRFYEDAKKMDGGKKNPYWSTTIEMAARSFEAYLVDKLKEKGRKNDYLSGHANNDEYSGEWYPYPTERDRVKINKAFDELFEVIRNENAIRKAIKILDGDVFIPQVITNGKRFLIRRKIMKSLLR